MLSDCCDYTCKRSFEVDSKVSRAHDSITWEGEISIARQVQLLQLAS